MSTSLHCDRIHTDTKRRFWNSGYTCSTLVPVLREAGEDTSSSADAPVTPEYALEIRVQQRACREQYCIVNSKFVKTAYEYVITYQEGSI